MASLLERDEELTLLRQLGDRPGPALVLMSNVSEAGIPTLLSTALRGAATAHLPCSDLSDLSHRDHLANAMSTAFGPIPPIETRQEPQQTPSESLGWSDLLQSVPIRGEGASFPRVVILTEAQRLLASNPRFLETLATAWEPIRRASNRVFLALCFGPGGFPSDLRDQTSALSSLVSLQLHEAPLTIRGVGELLASWKPTDRLLAWTLFGGIRSRMAMIDTDQTLRRNAQRLLLDPGGGLHRKMDGLLQRPSLTQPVRYATALGLVSSGSVTWREIRTGLQMRGEGRPGPYVAKLREMGMLESYVSLDAAGGQRNTRYRVADPLVAAWFRWILPHRSILLAGGSRGFWDSVLHPALRHALPGRVPYATVEVLRWRGLENVGPRAREAGALWGSGYEIPFAATLGNGAICYGTSPEDEGPASTDLLDSLSRQIRETRYGFGREVRLKILSSLAPPGIDLQRRAAQDDTIRLVGPTDLIGP